MKHSSSYRPASWALTIVTAPLALAGCDNAFDFNPVAPRFRTSALSEQRDLRIVGNLTSVAGGCLQATILYDGQELPGARVTCDTARGCRDLELSAVARSATGHHSIAFQVLRQASESADYRAQGALQVSRSGLSLTYTVALEPIRATLRAGEAVTFDVHFSNELPW